MKLWVLQSKVGPAQCYLRPDLGTTMKPKLAMKFSSQDEVNDFMQEHKSSWMFDAVEHEFEERELEADQQHHGGLK